MLLHRLCCVVICFFTCRVSPVRNPRASVLGCRVECRGPHGIRLLFVMNIQKSDEVFFVFFVLRCVGKRGETCMRRNTKKGRC